MDPVKPKALSDILRKLSDIVRFDYFNYTDYTNLPHPPGQTLNLVNEDTHWSVLPSFWFWLPTAQSRRLGPEAVRQARASVNYFPHVGITGRSQWRDFALGGAMMQIVSFRLYIIVAAPPAVDLVERLNNTLSIISFIILNRTSVPDYWWFTTVNEIEPLFRTSLFPQWTIGYLSGELRCHPQVLPFIYG